jgi:uncharacterized protein (TIGR02145 family)
MYYTLSIYRKLFVLLLISLNQFGCRKDITQPIITPCLDNPTVTDVDGNVYNTVLIGNQCWMRSNLKVSKYRSGEIISSVLINNDWKNLSYGAFSIYNNNLTDNDLYGKLYNHYAVTDSRGLCPTGWHVPSEIEWNTLVNFLGGFNVAGGPLKSTTTLPSSGGWKSPNTGATNSSGFSGLPGGRREYNGNFQDVAVGGDWWSSSVYSGSSGFSLSVYSSSSTISPGVSPPTLGLSVRCLRD